MHLDLGLYWYGHDDQQEKATGNASKYYDPSKKTVIYFHGWAGDGQGWTTGCTRATSRCPGYVCPDEDLLAEKWLEDGWNFGMFYWDQFADEQCTRDAEQKIWLSTGSKGMRWKSFDYNTGEAKFNELPDPAITVGDLCVQSLELAMKDFAGPQVRFVGHSIGAQLATRCGDLLHNRKASMAPHRLALLEPFFTTIHLGAFKCTMPDLHHEIGDSLPRFAAKAVDRMWETHGVPTEVYKSSALTEMSIYGEPDHHLERVSTMVTYSADFCGELGGHFGERLKFIGQLGNLGCRHTAIFPVYFLLYNKPALKLVDDDGKSAKPILDSCPVPSSSCSNADLKQLVKRQYMMSGKQSWKQVEGMSTLALEDDAFKMMGPSDMSMGSDLILADEETTIAPTRKPAMRGNFIVSTSLVPYLEYVPDAAPQHIGSVESRIPHQWLLGPCFVGLTLIGCSVGAYWKWQRRFGTRGELVSTSEFWADEF